MNHPKSMLQLSGFHYTWRVGGLSKVGFLKGRLMGILKGICRGGGVWDFVSLGFRV